MQKLHDRILVSPASKQDLQNLFAVIHAQDVGQLRHEGAKIDEVLNSLDPAIYSLGYSYLLYVPSDLWSLKDVWETKELLFCSSDTSVRLARCLQKGSWQGSFGCCKASVVTLINIPRVFLTVCAFHASHRFSQPSVCSFLLVLCCFSLIEQSRTSFRRFRKQWKRSARIAYCRSSAKLSVYSNKGM